MLLKLRPPSTLTCHCTLGVGEPVAWAVKVAIWPAATDWLAGEPLAPTAGTLPETVRVAGLLVTLPGPLPKRASYWLPLSAVCAIRVRAAEVALGLFKTGWKMLALFLSTNH